MNSSLHLRKFVKSKFLLFHKRIWSDYKKSHGSQSLDTGFVPPLPSVKVGHISKKSKMSETQKVSFLGKFDI